MLGLGWILTFIPLFLPFYAHLHGFKSGVSLAMLLGLLGFFAAVKGALFPKQILITSLLLAFLSIFMKFTTVQLILIYIAGWFLFENVQITRLWYM